MVNRYKYTTGDNDWYTPIAVISAARKVMGGIDLDPASSDLANQTVRASRYFSIQDNGLNKVWSGRIFMNPPYSKDLVGDFVAKLCRHVKNADVSQAVLLTNSSVDTIWFQEALGLASAVCLCAGRIKFKNPKTGQVNSPLTGQAITYFGPNAEEFYWKFAVFGDVLFTMSAIRNGLVRQNGSVK